MSWGQKNLASACVTVVMQGSRPLLLEIQALCTTTPSPPGRRVVNGVDAQRFPLLLAILSKQAGLPLGNQDIFVNVVGGMQLKEPSTDVAIAVAIASSFFEKPVPADVAFLGELGLQGELRPVGQAERRVAEAMRLGFHRCVVPTGVSSRMEKHGFPSENSQHFPENPVLISCKNIGDVLKKVLSM
eukprot:TRINITY_DN8809_c2_g4_i1.p1 TRINITY_DN8809_c2_g4~~TRINITY_DN8809_c2_g4_i1.p1  ORF type:complete len:186 (+),score=53.13 TRINITY_DN8809_c2_g4_i1:87-644(+)